MAGKFFRRDAIIDTRRNLDRMNALQKRHGPVRYHTTRITYGCPDPICGAYGCVDATRPLPTTQQAEQTLVAYKNQRKARRRRFNRARLEQLRARAARQPRQPTDSLSECAFPHDGTGQPLSVNAVQPKLDATFFQYLN